MSSRVESLFGGETDAAADADRLNNEGGGEQAGMCVFTRSVDDDLVWISCTGGGEGGGGRLCCSLSFSCSGPNPLLGLCGVCVCVFVSLSLPLCSFGANLTDFRQTIV